ncbi:hypothetical protein D1BOALGB6SA_8148 [Olavius sp. associated proteobacterium Delta 1]|nr:hypothetical protein D1BOALGB6SA_8148 [Olavius sp. associated proteobacterium Delta 1]
MAIQVIIRRSFEGEEKAQKLAPLIVHLRSEAMIQPGYISNEQLTRSSCFVVKELL